MIGDIKSTVVLISQLKGAVHPLVLVLLIEGVHKKLTFLWLRSFGANFRKMIFIYIQEFSQNMV